MRLPGTYAPQHDTALLINTLRASGLARGRRVLDLCTGSGAVAVAAAGEGAASVTAVDLSHRAIVSARVNSLLMRAGVDIRRGDLFAPIAGERFDLVVCNPPYVPAVDDRLPRHKRGRSWDAGRDGRALVDRICRGVADVLLPGGTILMTHTAVINAERTLKLFAWHGFESRIVSSQRVPFGPVMSARADLLATRGMIQPDEWIEELVVVRATLRSAPILDLPSVEAVAGVAVAAPADRLAG